MIDIGRLQFFRAAVLLLCGLVWAPAVGYAGEDILLTEWLARPGVRLLAIEFYATWCKPCMAAMPRWKALQERYYKEGLRVVVVNTQDPEGGCRSVGFVPDETVCDLDGRLSTQFGLDGKLPAAFLWSWQGGLLVQKGHIDEVERAVARYLGDAPRVIVQAGPGVTAPAVDGLREALSNEGKVLVVAGEDERKALDAARRAQASAHYDEKLQCELGREVPPNTMLRASKVVQGNVAFLTVGLFDLQTGCQLQIASAAWEKDARHMAQEAVAKLLGKLKQGRVQMPGASVQSRKAPKPDEVKQGGGEAWLPGDDESVLVQFASQPTGAAVELDGKGVCTTPCKQAVAGGAHKVRMGKVKFASREEQVALQAGSRVDWKLEATTATVVIDVGEAGLPIKVDGESAGNTPLTAQLDEGRHHVELASPCHEDASMNLTLQRGERKTLPLKAVARVSALKVEAQDGHGSAVEGEVRVDGRTVGPTWKALSVPLCSKTAVVHVDGVEVWRASLQLKEREVLKLGALMTSGGSAKPSGNSASSCARTDVAACTLACQGGEAASCRNLGDLFRDGKLVAKDEARAAKLLRSACDGGDAEGCADLAGMFRNGRGVAKDSVRAFELYRLACDSGYGEGCFMLAACFAQGIGVGSDRVKANAHYGKSCDVGFLTGCTMLGASFQDGLGVGKDLSKAASLYRKACDGGDALGCNNLGVMYFRGNGVAADYPKAAELYGKACTGGMAKACENLGLAFQMGAGVSADPARAADFYRKACDGGIASGCNYLGLLYHQGEGVPEDDRKASEYFRKSCDGGYAEACDNIKKL